MKFTVSLPIHDITPGEFQTPAAVREVVGALEAAKIDAGYLTDHPIPFAPWLHANGHDALDGFTGLAFVAALTTRLTLHTNVLVAAYRNPFLVAKAAATLQVLSEGRLILGMGAGYQKEEFDALGVDFHRRGKLFDEAVEVIRLAWSGGAIKYEGSNFAAIDNEARPAPSPTPPIWIGGGSEKAVERAARLGDGWSPFYSAPNQSASNRANAVTSIEQFAEKIDRVKELRAKLGKTTPFDFSIGPRARLDFGKTGGGDAFLEELRDLAAVGMTWASLDLPHRSRQEYIENIQWLGEEVVAHSH